MTRHPLSALLLLAGFFASACTAILVPDEGDDGVQRCDNTEECDATGDNRLEAVCVFGEGQDEGSQKVCAVQYTEPQCVPDAFVADHPFRVAYEEAIAGLGTRYIGCEGEENGVGCPPFGEQCAEGLSVNAQGYCDDGEGDCCDDVDGDDCETGESYCDDGERLPAVAVDSDNIGQDVLDQYCRYRFCDASFVCDQSAGTPTCVPCRDDAPYGEGGCGNLYSSAATPSTVYLHEKTDEGSCGAHDADNTQFGDLPPEP